MNPLEEKMITGTVGELLVQLRLLEYDVQAAAPMKDSGNDLIAIRGRQFRAIQVKATRDVKTFRFGDKTLQARSYPILAAVELVGENSRLKLDRRQIYLVPREAIERDYCKRENLHEFKLCMSLLDLLVGDARAR